MLGISVNFKVLSETPQAEATQSGGGNFHDLGGTLLPTVGLIQETVYSIQHGSLKNSSCQWTIQAERLKVVT